MANHESLPDGFRLLHHAADASRDAGPQAELCVQLADDGVMAAVYDAERQRFIQAWAYRSEKPLTAWLRKSDIFWQLLPRQDYARIRFLLPGLKVQLVPDALYADSIREDFFRLNHLAAPHDRIGLNGITRLHASLLYSIPSQLYFQLRANFPDASLYHQDAPLLEYLLMQQKTESGMRVHIEILPDGVGIFVFRDAALQLYNLFTCHTDEDRLYYVMFICEQLRVNPHRDPFTLSGRYSRTDEMFTLFSRYIRELRTAPRPEMFHYGLPLLELPEQLFYNVFCSPVCES